MYKTISDVVEIQEAINLNGKRSCYIYQRRNRVYKRQRTRVIKLSPTRSDFQRAQLVVVVIVAFVVVCTRDPMQSIRVNILSSKEKEIDGDATRERERKRYAKRDRGWHLFTYPARCQCDIISRERRSYRLNCSAG